MGNQGSSDKYNKNGGIGMQLENYHLMTGEEVQGTIYISLQQAIAPSTLYLIFLGKEETRWVESHKETYRIAGEKFTRSVTDEYKGHKKICNFKYPIHEFQNPIMPGDFSMPFTFKLPQNIPGSFEYSNGSTSAKIEYKFHAKLLSRENQNFKGKVLIHLKQPDYNRHSSVEASVVANLSTWCCLNKGTCKIHVDHASDGYTPSQTATLTVQVDNSLSKLNVTEILCRLIMTIRIKNNDERVHFLSSTVLQESIKREIPPGDPILSKTDVDLSLNLAKVKEELDKRYTTNGQLIECTYHIEAGVDVDGTLMCCGNTPTVSIPILIYSDNSLQYAPPIAPLNWNPTELKSAYIEYKEASNDLNSNHNDMNIIND